MFNLLKSIKMKMFKSLLIGLMTLFTLNSFAVNTYSVTKGITTNVNCMVGDTLKFYAQVPSAYGVQINGVTTTSVHPVSTSPYFIGYHVVVSGDNSFTILGSPNWSGTITVNVATGISENTSNNFDIKAFPNPVINEVTIKSNTNGDLGKVSVFNIAGQLVYEDKVEGNTTKIDFFSFSSGVYIVKVGEKSMKLIKP